MRADPEEKQGLAKNIEHWGVGQLGRRLTSTRRIEKRSPGDSPTTVSGRIGSDGAVDLDIRRSIAKVDANGRLNGKAGSGTWQLGMLGCSGRWTAQKRTSDV